MKKMKAARRVLIMLMAFLLLAGLVPITASAATPYSGQMVPGNYEITSADQLDTLAKRVNDSGYNYPGSTFTLLNDIDMSGRTLDADWDNTGWHDIISVFRRLRWRREHYLEPYLQRSSVCRLIRACIRYQQLSC